MRKRLSSVLGTLVVLGVLGFFIFRQGIDFTKMQDALLGLRPEFLALSLLFSLFQVLFWALRPWPLIRKEGLSFFLLAKAVVIGQFLNTFAPARVGDVTKVLMLSSKKEKKRLSGVAATGLLLGDKVVDFCSILTVVTVFGVYDSHVMKISIPAPPLAAIVGISLLAAGLIFFAIQKWGNQIRKWWAEFLTSLSPLLAWKSFLPAYLFGCGVWILEAMAAWTVLKSAGISADFTTAFSIICIVNLGILIPVSLANLGAYEAAFIYALSKLNVDPSLAATLAIIQHVLQMSAIALGALFFNVSSQRSASSNALIAEY